ncbi:MAG: hypothetical protein JWP08_1007 [Bryobacterales bacterium]|jgi:hypothetical protein|nr:hypothetical protein [Bryobacterales bacterium]
MLDQIVRWMQIIGTFMEFLLLLRMLILRFQRVYLFLTLYAVINFLVDASIILVGTESDPGNRIFFYSRFLFAVVYPLAAWDVFEEAKAQVSKIRRIHLPRLVSGMFITFLLGIATSFGIEDQYFKGTSTSTDFMGLFLWLGAASTSLLFTWNVFRTSRKGDVLLPSNTSVWAVFFLITFARAVIDCGFDVAGGLLPHGAFQVINAILLLFDLSLITWCLVRLKPLSPDVTSAPEKARS